MPSFEVASNCSVVIPFASKNAGIVLTLTGAAPFSASHRDFGVVKSSYVKKKDSDWSLVAVSSAVPSPGVGISARFQPPSSSSESAVRRLRTLSSVWSSTRSRVRSTPASETRALGSKSTSNRRAPREEVVDRSGEKRALAVGLAADRPVAAQREEEPVAEEDARAARPRAGPA